ncbi:MAG: hypothetical protein HRU75_12250 [Planctomycetia bacterium]|nr:MAG: hypothetical protein HRU75_12250 [Planctomycetia bacterium]
MRQALRAMTISGALLAAFALATGCSVTGAASTGFGVWKNTQANQLDTTIWIDGNQASRDELKQAATGYSRWTCSGDITASPTLKFEFKKPDAIGRIRSIVINIFQKHEARYSDQPDFIIVSRSQDPESQMKPGVVYDLAHLGPDFKVLNWKGEEIPAVQLQPGWQYMMNFVVAADDSETAQIFFAANKPAGPKTASH